MKKFEFEVDGIKCGGCVSKIEKGFESFEGIDSLDVSVIEKIVSISGDDKLSGMKIKTTIEELGFTVQSMKKID